MATTVTAPVGNSIGLASRYLPILDEIYKAGSKTAVFDMAAGSLAYMDEAQMVDLAPAVKKELGIAENAQQPAPAAAK